MRILIFSVNPQSPHLETDLELAKLCQEKQHHVTIVRSTGQLKACVDNPNHSPVICAACQSKFNNAVKLTNLSGVDIISFPEVSANYSVLPKLFATIEDLKRFKIDGLDAGNSVATTLMGRINKNHRFDTQRNRGKVQRELEMWLDLYEGCKVLLDQVQPAEVYFFNGRFSSYHPLRHLCMRRKIDYYTHERGGIIGKYILRKNALPHNIELTTREINELWSNAGDDREAVGRKFFEDRRGRVVQSWVAFTEGQQKNLLPKGFDPKKKNIVIFNSTMEEYEGMDEWVNPIYADDNVGIARVLGSFEGESEYVIYLRVHPNLKYLDNAQVQEIEALAKKYKNCILIRAEQTVDSYALLDNAFKVVCFGSTIGAEATYWNKVSVLLGKSTYMNLNAVYEPRTHEEAVRLLKDESLQPKPQINAVKYGHWELVKGESYKHFNQLDLFTMAVNGTVVKPNLALKILRKVSRLSLVGNKRDLTTMVEKVKKIIRWS